ncbi:hypothetical protein TTHERM_00289280 (macronuclear) [Tetrahymena thermophila SB210]|uniref:Uncharacterized protein n=1 Tax=Tetrahymena thermophila (strain SB210) TaxID=312017 RepID=I7LVK4_TETTS|nr:hypothetical protein TTHERM_00289280 [Tetrahymena thermophila SB210]EAR98400.1 hypothetical protein TTHERM_00289280 [Tetrahymena thermophila SB210]|eukprot:XP_001018645.1 hypothetical protein TTHERM_00289280 [Tetrahymena thermophila SB210]
MSDDDSYDLSSLEVQIMDMKQKKQQQNESQNGIHPHKQALIKRPSSYKIRRKFSQDQAQALRYAEESQANDKQDIFPQSTRNQTPFKINLNNNKLFQKDFDQQNPKNIRISSASAKQIMSRKQIYKEQIQNQEKQEQGQQSSRPNIFQLNEQEDLKQLRMNFLLKSQELQNQNQNGIKHQQFNNKISTPQNFRKKTNLIQQHFQKEEIVNESSQYYDLSPEKDNFFEINNEQIHNQLGAQQDQLPKKILKSDVQKLKVELERYQRLAQTVKEISMVSYLRKSINQLERAQKNEQEYLNIIQKQSNQYMRQEVDMVKQKNISLRREINNQSIRINELQSQVSNLLEYKELHEEEQQKNSKLQNELQEKVTLIENQTQQILEKSKIIEQSTIQIKEKDESIQNQMLEIQQKEKKFEELKIQLEQQKEKQENQINQLNQDKNELTKYKDLYEQSQQSLIQIQKEKGDEVEKYKKLNQELQKSLEASQLKQTEAQIQNIQKIFKDIINTQVKGGNGDQQVKEVLQQLNPQTKVKDNAVQFTKAYQVVSQSQPSDQQKKDLQVKNDDIVQNYLQGMQKIQQGNATQNEVNKDDKDSLKCLMILQNMFKQDGISTFITDTPIQTLEKDKNYQVQQSFLQVGLHNQAKYFTIKIDKQSTLYQNLIQSKTKQNINEFLQKFKEDIGQKVNSQNPQQDITIINVDFDKLLQIDFQVNSQQFSSQELRKKITFSDLGLSVSEKSLLEFAKLSVNMFDSQYNMEWPESYKGKHDVRGQLKFFDKINPVDHMYHYPAGYKGYALNINRYGEDRSWISSNADANTWIVLFHGTNENALSGIMKENLVPGYRNLHGGDKCRITNTIIKKGPKENVYLTDDMSIAEHFAGVSSSYEGKKYYIVFQCRVNPNGVKSPVNEPRYYTVEDNQNIRPYRIILKEVK